MAIFFKKPRMTSESFVVPPIQWHSMALITQNKMWCLTCIAAASFLAISSPSAWTADPDWTGWLGPERNGWVDGFQPPQTWPDNLQKTWRVEVGEGYGSPLVANGHVYQHARQGDNEVTWCIDLDNGRHFGSKVNQRPSK